MNGFFRTELWAPLLDILFPVRCPGCGIGIKESHQASYCRACQQGIRVIQEPFCTTCGKPFAKSAGKNHLCSYCLKNGWHFTRARAVVYYQGPIAEAVKLYKYQGKMYGLASFAALAHQYLEHQPLEQPDLLIPVPLHIKRLRQRGFNQALILCRKIFPEWRDRLDPHLLERHLGTRPQAGLRSAERRSNVRNAFKVRRPEKVKNKKILLVDDVFTTGATVNECAGVLKRCQASRVDVFTFARAIT